MMNRKGAPPGQYASVGGRLWNAAANPSMLNRFETPIWSLSLRVANGVLQGTIADPFASQGGTYGFRTTWSGPPGGSFKVFNDQIPGSGNTFYGLTQ